MRIIAEYNMMRIIMMEKWWWWWWIRQNSQYWFIDARGCLLWVGWRADDFVIHMQYQTIELFHNGLFVYYEFVTVYLDTIFIMPSSFFHVFNIVIIILLSLMLLSSAYNRVMWTKDDSFILCRTPTYMYYKLETV